MYRPMRTMLPLLTILTLVAGVLAGDPGRATNTQVVQVASGPMEDAQSHCLPNGPPPAAGCPSYEEATRARGDLNCDGAVDFGDINPFVLALIDPATYEAAFPGCNILNADINENGTVGLDDINPFVALLTGPHLGDVSRTDCRDDGGGERVMCPADVILFMAEGSTLLAHHLNAEYNCCLQDVAISLTVTGNLIRLEETEIVPAPCLCVCCYELWAIVTGLLPGTYTVEYCWYEYDTHRLECHTGTVVIVPPAHDDTKADGYSQTSVTSTRS